MTRKIHWREVFIGALIGALFSVVIGLFMNTIQDKRAKRVLAERVLQHVSFELAMNFEAIQIKGGLSFGALSEELKDKSSLRYDLSIIELTPFYDMAPKVWGQDFKVLLSFGNLGKRAYTVIVEVYARIEKTKKDEEKIINLIQEEHDLDQQSELLNMLHKLYDSLRTPLMEALKSLKNLEETLTMLNMKLFVLSPHKDATLL